jgi:hypothetical protein
MHLFVLFMLLTAVSCSTSKYQNGFVYKPAHQGPGFSGNMTGETATPIPNESATDLQPAALASSEISPPQDNAPTASLAPGEKSPPMAVSADGGPELAMLSRLANEQAGTAKVSETANAGHFVRELATAYAKEKQLTLSGRQLRKLDRYAAKLEKKQQKNADVDWGPQNNLEIFILAAAGVGLIVGLFSGIGWLVFIVAALAYLYVKLLA